jgi:putative transposase
VEKVMERLQYPLAGAGSTSSIFQQRSKFSWALKGRGFSPAVPVGRIWALAPEGVVRAKREPARNNHQTYFVTFQTIDRKAFFRNERWAVFFMSVLMRYRNEFALHDFVVMHDHVHLLLTPNGALERSIQLAKGGFSFSAKREFSWKGDIWQPGFSDHRVRDINDWDQHIAYIRKNVLSLKQPEYRFCGEHAEVAMDAVPQWLKPLNSGGSDGGAEAPPLQNEAEAPPLQSGFEAGAIEPGCETRPLQSGFEVRAIQSACENMPFKNILESKDS